jgi:hypothetical protein
MIEPFVFFKNGASFDTSSLSNALKTDDKLIYIYDRIFYLYSNHVLEYESTD